MLVPRHDRAASAPARQALIFVLLVLFSVPAFAGTVTLAWDPNPPSDNVVKYVVYYGTQPGTQAADYPFSQDVGNVTTWISSNLGPGTYYFAVEAVNSAGLRSPLSTPVSTSVSITGETQTAWMTRFGITDMTADPDGDGVSNMNEFLNGTDPGLPNTWILAEGASGNFNARFAILNPGTDQAEITVTFYREGKTPVSLPYSIPSQSRRTINAADIPDLAWTSFSTQVTTQRGGVFVERTMTWGGADRTEAGHTGKAVSGPAFDWYFAEGDAHGFDTYLLLANANAADVNVDVTYMLDSGSALRQTYTVAANARKTIYTKNVAGVVGTSFSMSVHASAPINAERAMYFGTNGSAYLGGTDSAGVEAPSTQWFVAEGHTGPAFDEFILLANPNPTSTTATVRFLRPTGPVITQSYALSPNSRTTVWVNQITGLEYTDVSASISATAPIAVERSMYWDRRDTGWHEGHSAVALAAIGTEWALAEGETGGPKNAVSYILMANPNAQDAAVTVTLLRDNGLPPLTVTKTVPANSRVTLNSTSLGLVPGETFGARVTSTNGVPIAVERSMYWDSATRVWSAGTCETGFLLK